MCVLRALCLLSLLVTALTARADPLNLVGSATEELRLLNAESSELLMRGRSPVPCCFIGTDAIARDNSSDRTWVATRESEVAVLRRFDAFGNVSTLTLEPDRFVLGLGHDAVRGEVVALLRDRDDQSLAVRRYAATDGNFIADRAVSEGCCRLLAGTVAWSTTRRAFVALGYDDAAPASLQIRVLPALGASDSSAPLDLLGLSAQSLAEDPDDGALYLLMHDAVARSTKLARIATSGLVIPAKFAEAECCHVLSSRATIESGMPYLDVVTRGLAETDFTLRRFALADGQVAPVAGITTSAGLLSDPVVPVTADIFFSDGFEQSAKRLR
jgi:hypothetical protein